MPLLIDVARKNKNPAVRKQAMFWLGQSKDPRAIEFFAEILEIGSGSLSLSAPTPSVHPGLVCSMTDRRRAAGSPSPTSLSVHVEHQVQLDVGHQPRGLRQLVVELSGPPAGVAGDDTRARLGRRLEHARAAAAGEVER